MMVADRATGTGEQGPSCLSTVRRIFFVFSAPSQGTSGLPYTKPWYPMPPSPPQMAAWLANSSHPAVGLPEPCLGQRPVTNLLDSKHLPGVCEVLHRMISHEQNRYPGDDWFWAVQSAGLEVVTRLVSLRSITSRILPGGTWNNSDRKRRLLTLGGHS